MNSIFSKQVADLIAQAEQLATQIAGLPLPDKVDALNGIRTALHAVSPFRNEPVDCIQWVRGEEVEANDYNPNGVQPPEMRLLAHSIANDGYTQPIVAFPLSAVVKGMMAQGQAAEEIADQLGEEVEKIERFAGMEAGRETVDGFHRGRVGKENTAVRKRVHGYLPVADIKPENQTLNNRMASTIRHNRARGVHAVIPMVDIVVALLQLGWEDDRIAKELGMDADEVLRFKQTSGLTALFKNQDYSKAWE